MKKLRIPLLVIALLAAMLVPVAAGEPQEKVTLCHKPGTPAEVTIAVGAPAVDAHLAHGDYYGECSQPSEGCQAFNAYFPDPQYDPTKYAQELYGVFNAGETIHVEMTATFEAGGAFGVGVVRLSDGDSVVDFKEYIMAGETETVSVDYLITADGTEAYAAAAVYDFPHQLVNVEFSCTR